MNNKMQQTQPGSLALLNNWASQSLTAEEMKKLMGGDGDEEIIDKPIYIKED